MVALSDDTDNIHNNSIRVMIHPVSVARFPSFQTQPLENLSHYL